MKKEEQQVFDKLAKSENLKEQQKVFGGMFEQPVWYAAHDIPSASSLDKYVLARCGPAIISRREKNRYISRIIAQFKKARRSRQVQKFKYSPDFGGFALPVVQGHKVYGYILLCRADKEIPERYLRLFKISVDAMLREAQKESELAKLYETIRPRAIALSTIHTIHRLISSTLDIDELLPRIARLSIQVMRASRCSIKLLDKKKKSLIPKTTVDVRKNKKINLKKLPIGKGIPGKAAKLEKAIKGKRYLSVPLIDQDMIGVITVYDKVNGQPFTQFDQEILTTLAEQAVIAIKNAQLYQEQQDVIVGSVKSLAMVLGTQDPHASPSAKLISKLSVEIGREMKMRLEDLRSLEVASLLHDAGQVSLPDQILEKQEGLTGEEYALVKEHPEKGAKIIEPLKALKPAIPMILHHHEKYDGTGYPKGLKADNIPLGARIMAVAGAFEAMVVSRPYRQKTKSVDEATEEIKRHSGTQFDPQIVNVFIKVVNKPSTQRFLKTFTGSANETGY